MNKTRKFLVTTACALALSTGFVAPAQAAPFSYYDMVAGMQGTSQTTFAKSMIRSYENAVRMFAPLVEKYGQFPWAANLVATSDFYKNEIVKFKLLIGGDEINQPVTETEKTYKYTYFPQTTETPETEVRTETVVEETIDYTVNVYLEVAIVYTKTVTTKNMKGTFTTQHYSDDSSHTTVKGETLSTDVEDVTRTVNEREFVRTYELERPVEVAEETEETNTDMGIATVNVLTVDEYLARDDVSYAGTQMYTDAVLTMNARIGEDYINRAMSKNANHLADINAPQAWAKGWTGKGSILSILDTGIDVDHSEFDGKIIDTKCFTRACDVNYESIDDKNKYSHGTHVAGIAAANLDGVGTTGVAYDAELLIGKIATDSGFYDMSLLGKGIEWSVNNGADAINVSGNYNSDITYKRSIIATQQEGVWESTDTRSNYATQGYSNLMTDTNYMLPSLVNAMDGNEAVVVMAAGNQRQQTPTFPAHFAIAEDETGELLLGGKVIIVGSWDTRTDSIATSSNRAGTMCFSKDTYGNCKSDRRISDWYIMAPGSNIASTSADNEYRTNSGTSMAAPVVTGAVGIVHQMWPYMKGENIVQLLLDTADKDITAYDVNIHGQGMLDLDTATNPFGAIGIPTTGRIEGARSSVTSGKFAMSGGAYISSLSSTMVVDDYDRNFYIDGNAAIQAIDTRSANPTQAAEMGFAPDYYFGYGNGTIVPTSIGALNINDDSMSFATTVDKFMFGIVSDSNGFLGNVADNALMDVNGSNTFYAGYNMDFAMSDNVTLFGNATLGVTQLNVGNSLMKSASSVLSNSATLGIKTDTYNGSYGFVASMPVAITKGQATFETASTVSATGDVEYATSNSSLSATNREFDLGMFRNFAIADNVELKAHVEARLNYAGTDETHTSAGVNIKWSF
jgi:hypothetical protein